MSADELARRIGKDRSTVYRFTRKKGGVRSPGDFCQTHHVQLLRIDYTVRSHPAGTENAYL